jgi:hypothetical protein
MVTVELSAESVETTDTTNRYFTIETSEISSDWELWPNKIILNKGTIGKFYARRVDLPPGPNKIWVGVTNFIGTWTFKIRAKVVATGQVFDEIDDYHPEHRFVNSYTINVPEAPTVTGTTEGGGFDPSQTINQMVQTMMNNMMPLMIGMTGMMMIMQMMQVMTGALAGAMAA